MQLEYVLGISCGTAGLFITSIALLILIRECRRGKSCCRKSNTLRNRSPKSATKDTTLSTLERETHLFDIGVANESSVSTFQNEPSCASVKMNTSKSSDEIQDERKNSDTMCKTEEKSVNDSNIMVGKDITKPVLNAKDVFKVEASTSGDENTTPTTENERGDTNIPNASGNNTSRNGNKNIKAPKRIPKIPILPPNAAAILRQKHKALNEDTIETEDSDGYITPTEFVADKEQTENNDYEEIKERKQTLKHAIKTAQPGAINGTKDASVSFNNSSSHNKATAKDKVTETINDKNADCSDKNNSDDLEGGSHTYFNKQLSDLNVEMKSRLENKITYANTPANKVGTFDTESVEDSPGVYSGCVKRENDEHVYSKLNAVT